MHDDAQAIAALACEVGVLLRAAHRSWSTTIWGVMAAGWADPLEPSSEAVERIGEFAELVATAIANTESRRADRGRERGVVAAADEARLIQPIFMTACSSSW